MCIKPILSPNKYDKSKLETEEHVDDYFTSTTLVSLTNFQFCGHCKLAHDYAHRVLRRSPHSVHVASLCGGKGANARFEVVSFQSE